MTAAAVCLGLVVAAPAWAAPQWLLPPTVMLGPDTVGETCQITPCPPYPTSYVGYDATPQVYMAATGDAVLLYVDKSGAGLIARTRAAGGNWGPPQTLDAGYRNSAQTPQFDVAFDGSGNATAVWEGPGTGFPVIDEADAPPGGTFSAPHVVFSSQDAAGYPAVAVNARGDTLVTWIEAGETHGNGAVDASIRPAGSPLFDAPVVLTAPNPDNGYVSQIFPPIPALDASGGAAVIWLRETSQGSGDQRVEAALRPPGGAFAAPQTLSGSNSSYPALAMDAAGDAIAMWDDSGGLESSFRPSGGAFPATATPVASAGSQAQVALDRAGNALAVWREQSGAGTSWVQTSVRPAGGTFSTPPTTLSDTGGAVAEGPDLAMDAHGDAVALWNYADNADPPLINTNTPHHVVADVRPAGGIFRPPTSLLDTPADVHGGQPSELSLGIDATGDAVAMFSNMGAGSQANTGVETVQSVAYDAAGPQLRALSVPGELKVGAAGLFSVAPVDVFSGVGTTSWDFGDGSVGQGAAVSHAYARSGTYTVTVHATDALGNGTSAQSTVTVTAPSSPPPGHPGSRAPVITHLRISPATFAAVRAGSRSHRRSGAVVAYRDSAAATTTFKVERLVAGRRVHGRCRALTRRNRRAGRCLLGVTVVVFRHRDRAGVNRVRLSGRIRGRTLAPGRYVLVAVARGAAGPGSPVDGRFRVRR